MSSQPLESAPALLTVAAAARLLGLDRRTVRLAIANGDIYAMKIGERRLIPRDRLLSDLRPDGDRS